LLNIFTNLDLIDQTGHGVPLIIDKFGENAFYISDNTIIVTIPINKELLEKVEDGELIILNNNELMVLEEMKKNNKITTKELVNTLKISEGYVEKIIRKLKSEGYISREGSNKTGYWKILK